MAATAAASAAGTGGGAEAHNMSVGVLGRPGFVLGALYDANNDRIVPGTTLWAQDVIDSNVKVDPSFHDDIEFFGSDTLDECVSHFDMHVGLKMSFMGGLVKVSGTADLLKDHSSSSHHATANLMLKRRTVTRRLTSGCLSERVIPDPSVLGEDHPATHVIVSITYGGDAVLNFQKRCESKTAKNKVAGSLHVVVKSIPGMQIEGDGSMKIDDKTRATVENLNVKLHMDCNVSGRRCLPTSFEQAVKFVSEFPQIWEECYGPLDVEGRSGLGVPIVASLVRIDALPVNDTAAKLLREISEGIMSDASLLFRRFGEMDRDANVLLHDAVDERKLRGGFGRVEADLKSFKKLVKEYNTVVIQKRMQQLLPHVRPGNGAEQCLVQLFDDVNAGAFSEDSVSTWLRRKKNEIAKLSGMLSAYVPASGAAVVKVAHDFMRCTAPDVDSAVAAVFVAPRDRGLEAMRSTLHRERQLNLVWNGEECVSMPVALPAYVPGHAEAAGVEWWRDQARVGNMGEAFALFREFSLANADPATVLSRRLGLEYDDAWDELKLAREGETGPKQRVSDALGHVPTTLRASLFLDYTSFEEDLAGFIDDVTESCLVVFKNGFGEAGFLPPCAPSQPRPVDEGPLGTMSWSTHRPGSLAIRRFEVEITSVMGTPMSWDAAQKVEVVTVSDGAAEGIRSGVEPADFVEELVLAPRNVRFQVRVRAECDAGFSPWSEKSEEVVLVLPPPSKPAKIDEHAPDKLTICWTGVRREASGGLLPILCYEIQVFDAASGNAVGDMRRLERPYPSVASDGGGAAAASPSSSGGGGGGGAAAAADASSPDTDSPDSCWGDGLLELVVNGLDCSSAYMFRVRAVSVAGEGEWSETSAVMSIETHRPGLQFRKDFAVGGLPDTFYPVVFPLQEDARVHTLKIFRFMAEPAPERCGLDLHIEAINSMWGGIPNTLDVKRHIFSGRATVGRVVLQEPDRRGVIVHLRGGGVKYNVESTCRCSVEHSNPLWTTPLMVKTQYFTYPDAQYNRSTAPIKEIDIGSPLAEHDPEHVGTTSGAYLDHPMLAPCPLVCHHTDSGMLNTKTLVVNGDVDTFFPVIFPLPSAAGGVHNIEIFRRYREQGPPEWDTSRRGHKASVSLHLQVLCGQWGALPVELRIKRHVSQYTPTVGTVKLLEPDGNGVVVWFRGGGAGGGIYHVAATSPLESDNPHHCVPLMTATQVYTHPSDPAWSRTYGPMTDFALLPTINPSGVWD